jgi:hypothetical protein
MAGAHAESNTISNLQMTVLVADSLNCEGFRRIYAGLERRWRINLAERAREAIGRGCTKANDRITSVIRTRNTKARELANVGPKGRSCMAARVRRMMSDTRSNRIDLRARNRLARYHRLRKSITKLSDDRSDSQNSA